MSEEKYWLYVFVNNSSGTKRVEGRIYSPCTEEYVASYERGRKVGDRYFISPYHDREFTIETLKAESWMLNALRTSEYYGCAGIKTLFGEDL